MTSVGTQEVVQANPATRIAWLVLNIWPSHLGLPLLIGTILLAKSIRRHATFINLCVTWIIVGISSSLLYVVLERSLLFLLALIFEFQLVCWLSDGPRTPKDVVSRTSISSLWPTWHVCVQFY